MDLLKWIGVFVVLLMPCRGAEVFELGEQNFEERPGGKEADSIAGDFLLRSSTVEAVVSGDLPMRRANMGAYYGDGNHTPGCLYDLTRLDRTFFLKLSYVWVR